MPAIVAFPTVVQDLMVHYHDLFANDPERRHCAEYLTGLFIAERKTVSGINRGHPQPYQRPWSELRRRPEVQSHHHRRWQGLESD